MLVRVPANTCRSPTSASRVRIYIFVYKAAASVCPSVSSEFLKNQRTDFHETFHVSQGSYVDVNGSQNIQKMSTPNV